MAIFAETLRSFTLFCHTHLPYLKEIDGFFDQLSYFFYELWSKTEVNFIVSFLRFKQH